MTADLIFEELLSQWLSHRGLQSPPAQPIRLWNEAGRGVWIADSWGPPVPYHPVDHGDGHQNYGYMRTKGDPAAVHRIPEVADWPELAEFLVAINAAESPIESVGCEKGFFPASAGDAAVKVGAYIRRDLYKPCAKRQR